MIKRTPTKRFYEKGIIVFLLFSFIFSFFIFPTRVYALSDIIGGPVAVIRKVTDWVENNKNKFLVKMGSSMFQSALRASLYTLAYDSATYLGTAAGGQKPMWETDYWTKYGDNIRDAAIGEALDVLGKEWDFNFCEPNISIKTKIGLGLTANYRPVEPKCGWQQMKNGWKNEFDRWASYADDPLKFLDQVAASIDPSASDIGITMSLLDKVLESGDKEKEKVETQLSFNQGWLDVRNIAGKQESVPGAMQGETDQTRDLTTKTFGQTSSDIFVDAVNIFSNQLLISLINSALKSYSDFRNGDNKVTPSNPFILSSPEADPSSYYSEATLTETLKKVLTPKFTEKTDYSILAELMICGSENSYSGPNNCVIGQSFGRAIENQNTLIEAINNGSISSGMLFSENGDYKNTLNKRSLMILRKFRIVPLGWEEALNRITPLQKSNSGQYTIMDLVSCFSGSDEYNQYSKNFPHDPNNESEVEWCRGLVDPYWVLKAPVNYCARQGYGGHVLSTQLISIPESKNSAGEVVQEASEDIMIIRSDSYCADERSCIKEANDGSCQFYGYCTEEKRTWNFNSDSCSSVFNTCESLTSSSGKKLALLKNTIKYTPCDASNSGCSIYAKNGTYDVANSKVNWSSDGAIHLNSKAETCSSGSEGCSEFIRTKSGFGHNFLVNGGFETNESWTSYFQQNKIQENIGYDGSRGILLTGGDVLNGSTIVGPDDNFLRGETFTLSFYSKCTATSTASIADMSTEDSKVVSPSPDFSYQTVSYTYPDNYSGSEVNFRINIGAGGQCYFDQLKLEKGSIGTFYSDYRGDGLIYLKTIPDYLKNTCYVAPYSANPDYRLKSDAPSECYRYARLCNFDELGCDLFKMSDGRSVPAKAMDKDYCPSECDGYDVYVQKSTIFESDYPYRLIPKTAKKCSASSVGCSQFTNLEDLSSGGERIEYYSYLRQCIKPEEGVCSNFYSWEGSDESGYQLKSFKLAMNSSQLSLTSGSLFSTGDSYKHVISGIDVCSREISKLPVSDPRYNSDCREFYNQAGEVFYVLYSKTLTCSDNCKRFRMTDRNIDRTITNAVDCNNLNTAGKIVAKWQTAVVDDYVSDQTEDSFVCFHCLNGGKWDDNQNACVYQAIPGEGKTCSASENSCREYSGNSGSNTKILTSYDFEQNVSNWQGGFESTESLNNNGKSIRINSSSEISRDISGLLSKGNSYLISFLSKNGTANSSNLEIYFMNSVGKVSNFKNVNTSTGVSENNLPIKGSTWQIYKINLENLDHDVDSGEKIFIKNNGPDTVYIDDLILSETNSRYYLIKNSWNTPNICYYDQTSKYQGPNYNLGCSTYLDRSNTKHTLRQFSKLCDSSAVGCELMIDTHNYTPKENAFFSNGQLNESISSCSAGQDCLEVPADNFSLVVYDSSKICNPADKGCSLFGKAISNIYSTSSSYLYQNIFIKNNPDKYNQGTLCARDAIGCDSWTSTSGVSYFKDPMDNVCQLVDNKWYVKKIKRCLIPGAVQSNLCLPGDTNCNSSLSVSNLPNPCNSDADCSGSEKCILDENNYLCPVDSDYGIVKTIGNNGVRISQPIAQANGVNWAGLCPLKESGCTEYIDPESSFNPNLILNSDFSDIDEDGTYFDGWTAVTPDGNNTVSGLNCKIVDSGSGAKTISCNQENSVYYFKQVNHFMEANKLYTIKYKNLANLRIRCDKTFYKLESNNLLSSVSLAGNDFYQLSQTSPYASKLLFYSGDNIAGDCEFVIDLNRTADISKVSIDWRELIVDYKIKSSLDFSSCSGPNFNNGCIIFNEREVSSNGWPNFSSFRYNSSDYANYNPAPSTAYKDANQIIKVKPDRVCGRWLSCYSYTTEKDEKGNDKNVCLQIGQCTSMDASGNCLNFSKSPVGNRAFSIAKDSNASGYSLLNNYYLDSMVQRGSTNVWSNDFEKKADLNSWQRKKSSNSSLIAIDSTCFISKSIDVNTPPFKSVLPTYPSPSNLGFARVGGGECDWAWYSPVVSVNTSSDYYLNFLINTANYRLTEGGNVEKVLGKIVGVKNGVIVENESTEISVDVSKKDWQRISIKFKTASDWNNGFRLILSPSLDNDTANNGWLYFDDVNVEPALETAENTYLPVSCRLYPKQDSISCYSDSKGYSFIEQGWEGYCLQKDPANENVCLLWYPVDSVVGSANSDLTTNFSGYADTGLQPIYCGQMNADFSLVEYRDVYLRDVTTDSGSVTEGTYFYGGSGCDSSYHNVLNKLWDSAAGDCRDIWYNYGGGERYNMKIYFCLPITGSKLIIPTNSKIIYGSQTTAKSITGSGTNSCSGNAVLCCRGSNCNTSCSGCGTMACDAQGGWWERFEARNFSDGNPNGSTYKSQAGWYLYNGSLGGKAETDNGLKLLAYNIKKSECEGGLYGTTTFIPAGTGNGRCSSTYCAQDSLAVTDPNKNGACLMDPDKYVPKCDQFIKGEIPWVERLKSSQYSLQQYNNSLTSAPFSHYRLGSVSVPFGAINTDGDVGSQNVYASSIGDSLLYGLPYSCIGKSSSIYMTGTGAGYRNSCESLYYDKASGKIKLTTSLDTQNRFIDTGTGWYNATTGASGALKNIFAKVSLDSSYSHLGSAPNLPPLSKPAETCNSYGCPERDNTKVCSVWPQINNIKISGPYGAVNQTEVESNIYNVVASGFYTISFNTVVDREQSPIKQMTIKIKKTTEDWKNSAPIILGPIDHRPNESNPHRLVRFLTPGQYIITIKVVDNWDFFRCSGIGGFNTSNIAYYDNQCFINCCLTGLSSDLCTACDDYINGPLFSCSSYIVPEKPVVVINPGTGTTTCDSNSCYFNSENKYCCQCQTDGVSSNMCYRCGYEPSFFPVCPDVTDPDEPCDPHDPDCIAVY